MKTKRFWKYYKSTKDVMEGDIERLRKTHEVTIDNKQVYVRRKKNFTEEMGLRKGAWVDYAHQRIEVPKKKGFWQRIKAWLLMLSLLVLANFWTIYFNDHLVAYAQPEIDPTAIKINLSPVEFTKEELEAFYLKYKAPETIEEKIRDVFFDDAEWALRCFWSESGLDPTKAHKNTKGTTDRGIAQVNSIHCSKVNGNCDRLFEVDENLRVARIIYDTQGKTAWYGRLCK